MACVAADSEAFLRLHCAAHLGLYLQTLFLGQHIRDIFIAPTGKHARRQGPVAAAHKKPRGNT